MTRKIAREIAAKAAIGFIAALLYSWLLSSSVSRLLTSIGEGP